MRHTFSASGVEQLRADVDAVQKVVDVSIELSGEAARGMRRLDDGVRLLGLPIRPSSKSSAAVVMGREEVEAEGWGFDDDVDDDGGEGTGGGEATQIPDSSQDYSVTPVEENEENVKAFSLWKVEKRIFRSNESARAVLAEMGIETLTEADARGVLERRVEVGS